MEVAQAAVDSGQGSGAAPPDTGNAGRQTDHLSDAITAAISATRKEREAPPPVEDGDSVEKTAGDESEVSDATAKEPTVKTEAPEKAQAKPSEERGEDGFKAPDHWPAERKKAFEAMPKETQSLIREMARDLEGGFTRKSMELADKARYADAVSGLLDDHTRSQIRANGLNEAQYFAYLNDRQQHASRDPVGYLKWAMQTLGVAPEHLGLPTSAPAAQQQTAPNAELEAWLSDPKVKQLEADLAQMKGYLGERHQAELRALQAQRMQAEQGLVGMAQQFRQSLDDAGQARYPHFDTVRTHMGALMETDPDLRSMPDGADKLAKAYDMAVWARPDLRSSFLEQEAARRVAAAEKAREAARAKQITAVKPSAGVPAQSAKPQSLDDIIRGQLTQRGLSY